MRQIPDSADAREERLRSLVAESIGTQRRFLDDGPDLSAKAIAELWRGAATTPDPKSARAWLTIMAVATDSFRGARASLYVHDLTGVFLQMRLADEMHTLAAAAGLDAASAASWLRGAPVDQAKLRRRVETLDPKLAESMRTTHGLLSDQAHGRAQALSVYETPEGQFAWPTDVDVADRSRVRAAFVTVCALLLSHLGLVKWMIRDWYVLPTDLAVHLHVFYDALAAFVLTHQEHGDWTVVAPGQAAAWLGLER